MNTNDGLPLTERTIKSRYECGFDESKVARVRQYLLSLSYEFERSIVTPLTARNLIYTEEQYAHRSININGTNYRSSAVVAHWENLT